MKCSKCKKRKSRSSFGADRNSATGTNIYCKDCNNTKSKQWKRANKEQCQIANDLWKLNNPEKVRQQGIRARAKRKKICIDKYGGKCVCCGEKEINFLSLDHIKDNGSIDRQNNPASVGSGIYVRLIRESFPKGFQTLCYNCQWGKRIGKGFCCHHPRTDLRK